MGLTSFTVGFGVHRLIVRSTVDSLTANLTFAFRHLITAEPGEVLSVVEVSGNDDHVTVSTTRSQRSYPRASEATRSVRRYIITAFCLANPQLLWFHAGAVQDGDSAILVPGAWGRGKSSTVAKLLEAGAKYFSDDVAPVEPDACVVHAFPITPAVRNGTNRLLPETDASALQKRWVDVAADDLSQKSAIRAILFPQFQPDGPQTVEEISPANAALELLKSCVNFSEYHGDPIEIVSEIASSTPAYTLRHNGLIDATNVLRALD